MENVTNFLERSKEFEQAHYSCKELLEDRINKIERFTSRWILIAIGGLFLFMTLGFVYFHFKFVDLRKKVDHRYFLLKESIEDVHNVKIENGKVIRNYPGN
jgi:hypothetical protein